MIRGVVASGKRRGGGVPVQIILTSGFAGWIVPIDWNSANNKIECVGAGARGGCAYARKNNLALTPGANIVYQIGKASSTQGVTDTWFDTTATVKAAGAIGNNGALATSCIGDVAYSGGNGTSGGSTAAGGGAAGPNGPGMDAVSSTGGAGDAGFGGAGGAPGQPGQPGTEWGAAGSGGGSGSGNGSVGGLYGAGSNSAAAGAPGVIVITYTPA